MTTELRILCQALGLAGRHSARVNTANQSDENSPAKPQPTDSFMAEVGRGGKPISFDLTPVNFQTAGALCNEWNHVNPQ